MNHWNPPITAYTDYPFRELGDVADGKTLAPIRCVQVLSYDGNKYCRIKVGEIELEVKRGYLYIEPGRCGEVRLLNVDALNHARNEDGSCDNDDKEKGEGATIGKGWTGPRKVSANPDAAPTPAIPRSPTVESDGSNNSGVVRSDLRPSSVLPVMTCEPPRVQIRNVTLLVEIPASSGPLYDGLRSGEDARAAEDAAASGAATPSPTVRKEPSTGQLLTTLVTVNNLPSGGAGIFLTWEMAREIWRLAQEAHRKNEKKLGVRYHVLKVKANK